MLPALMVTPTDADGQPSWTRPVRDQAELDRSVLGIDPSSPVIPSISQLCVDDDLGPMSEGLLDALLVPDPASSGSAPRFPNNDWDGKTQVPDAQEHTKSRNTVTKALLSSREVVEMLFSDMKEPAIAAIQRSWTFPCQGLCLPSSVCFFSMLKYALRNRYIPQVGFFFDRKILDDAKTLVVEPVELLPKVDSVSREALRAVESVESFVSLDGPW
jgi:hypothetical protein